MADITQPSITDINKLKVGIEYEGRPPVVRNLFRSLPLIRGTFKKIITDDGDKFAVFDPIFRGPDEYHLVKHEGNSEDVAMIEKLYNFFPLRIGATKKFEQDLKERPAEYREKRQAVRGLQGRYDGRVIPHEIADKIAEMATGVKKRNPVTKKTTGGRSTGGRRVHKKRRTHKQKRTDQGPYINPTYNTLPFKR